ncbi:kinase-like protein [Sodiomyces alkalinus F11]|uniref:mitogen-activated protein kinase kinase n=1 Tax=Sodiomyces alkalinus (strain CBS 110278 / VKM F-3762 / F11) TaxID=1314773 RepID=A0A3N2Q304_SODAK|nr:kinase-like protein [Sodiomyces alkalinus F11]ROT41058.1 kinase-like protein [Sodiomyces alkalinus F11]
MEKTRNPGVEPEREALKTITAPYGVFSNSGSTHTCTRRHLDQSLSMQEQVQVQLPKSALQELPGRQTKGPSWEEIIASIRSIHFALVLVVTTIFVRIRDLRRATPGRFRYKAFYRAGPIWAWSLNPALFLLPSILTRLGCSSRSSWAHWLAVLALLSSLSPFYERAGKQTIHRQPLLLHSDNSNCELIDCVFPLFLPTSEPGLEPTPGRRRSRPCPDSVVANHNVSLYRLAAALVSSFRSASTFPQLRTLCHILLLEQSISSSHFPTCRARGALSITIATCEAQLITVCFTMSGLNSPDSFPATPDELAGPYDALSSPDTPGSIDSSDAGTPTETAADHKKVPSLRPVSDPPSMNPTSTPLGILSNARRPPPAAVSMMGNGPVNDVMARARALHAQRMGRSAAPTEHPPNPANTPVSPASSGSPVGGLPSNMRLPGGVPPGLARPVPGNMPRSAPSIPASLSSRRKPKMSLSDMGGGPAPSGDGGDGSAGGENKGSKMNDFKKYIDSEKGWITFGGTATITGSGVDFASGQTFRISLDEVEVLDELGKGNYGTVFKVKHAKPRKPRFGAGLTGFKRPAGLRHSATDPLTNQGVGGQGAKEGSPIYPITTRDNGSSGTIMAMKEIRLELEETKFTTILRELVILHQCVSPYIIDFYGAFFQEGAVYMCIEYMDGGSIDKLYAGGVPENVLKKISHSTILGLKSLKDDHSIIHRDVKPTNILVNTRGQIKICDFGVSGNLVASMAKTNIGCQSYMAPERISGGGMAAGADGTYSVQSDIWSLGLTIIECAMGRYPYPPEVSSTIFSQLSAIVEGDPPDLPADNYSDMARDFVTRCLNKVPKERPTYAMLLQHPWIAHLSKFETITEEVEEGDESDAVADAVGKMHLNHGTEDEEVADWVKMILERKAKGVSDGAPQRPALHAAPFDVSPAAVSPAAAM